MTDENDRWAEVLRECDGSGDSDGDGGGYSGDERREKGGRSLESDI